MRRREDFLQKAHGDLEDQAHWENPSTQEGCPSVGENHLSGKGWGVFTKFGGEWGIHGGHHRQLARKVETQRNPAEAGRDRQGSWEAGCCIKVFSHKQECPALSSAKAELCAMTEYSKELVSLAMLLESIYHSADDFGPLNAWLGPINCFCATTPLLRFRSAPWKGCYVALGTSNFVRATFKCWWSVVWFWNTFLVWRIQVVGWRSLSKREKCSSIWSGKWVWSTVWTPIVFRGWNHFWFSCNPKKGRTWCVGSQSEIWIFENFAWHKLFC